MDFAQTQNTSTAAGAMWDPTNVVTNTNTNTCPSSAYIDSPPIAAGLVNRSDPPIADSLQAAQLKGDLKCPHESAPAIPVQSGDADLWDGIEIGTIVTDRHARVRAFTRPATVAVALTERDLGRPLDHLAHNLQDDTLARDLYAVLNGAGPIERSHTTLDGQQLLTQINAQHRSDRALTGAVVTVMDISALKSAQQTLWRVNDQIKQQNREIEDFTYTISHDLKSPLVTIGGMIGLVLDRMVAGDETVRDCLQTAASTVEQMRHTIDELLHLSRLGRVTHDPQPLPLGPLVAMLLNRHKNELADNAVSVQIHGDLPTVQADPNRIEQVWENLIVNALKYACDQPAAQIEIGHTRVSNRTRVYLRDNGPGIARDHHEKIFGLFQRLNNQKDGSGLGLAIVRRVMEAHHGRVWVESQLGHGATFWLEFPD